MMSTYGESVFDGPGMAGAKAPLIGGGAAQLAIILVKKFLPSQAKHAGAIGAVAGAGVAYALKNRLGPEGMGAAIAAALVVGIPREINDFMGGTLMGDDFGAITAESLADFGADASGVQIMDAGGGSTGLAAITAENMGAPAEGVMIQGDAFGATGM